jgi:DNA polymerase-3 subunit epsilon
MPNIVILDTESTGLPSSEWARVVEIGAVALGPDGHVLGTFESLVCPEPGWARPGRVDRALALSGIAFDDVCAAPSEREAQECLSRWLENFSATRVWSFNRVFDETMLARSGFYLPWPDGAGCVMRLARQHMPHKEKDPSLGEAMHFFGIERRGDAHRALSDAIGAAGVYVACRERESSYANTQSTYNAPVPTLSSISEVVEQERARLTGTQFTLSRPWEP